MIENKDVKPCPINGNAGELGFLNVVDRFFGTVGEWSYKKDPVTGHLWIDPLPSVADMAVMYEVYYTHAPEQSIESTAVAKANAWILKKKLGYGIAANPGIAGRLVSWLPTMRAAALMDVFKLPAQIQGRLLDFGCGNGNFLKRMKDFGWDVAGIEPDAKAAAALRTEGRLDVRASLEEFQGEGKFDVITLSHVIEHLIDPQETLRQLAIELAPGGSIILTTPNAKSLGCKAFGRNWRGLEPPRHFNIFTPASMRQVLARAGLSCVSLTTETRMARRLFWISALAALGDKEIEKSPRPIRTIKLAGYIFQVVEGVLGRFGLEAGEEIFCCARVLP